jgi:hypothetical protein
MREQISLHCSNGAGGTALKPPQAKQNQAFMKSKGQQPICPAVLLSRGPIGTQVAAPSLHEEGVQKTAAERILNK